jgi:hypothetical protein
MVGASAPAIVIKQPLAFASATGSAPLAYCDGACPGLPAEVAFDETWTGTGEIARSLERGTDLAPGVRLDMTRGVSFFRVATLGTPDPFDGALGDLGSLTTSDPGVRFFDVHLAFITVCHPGGCSES